MSDVAQIRDQALEVAAGWSPPDGPDSWRLTAALFRLIAGHEALLAGLAGLPDDRLPALLASAAISFLVRRDRPAALAGYFPEPGAPQPPFDDGFSAAGAGFVSSRLTEILTICRTRRYQMNEVARCTQLAAGLAAVSSRASGSVALVDLGTGAGFGLQLDRYRYDLSGTGTGPQPAGLTLECVVRGTRRPPRPELPLISYRAGIDADPVDLRDPAARAWLVACAPPEASALRRLAAATQVSLEHPAPVAAGDVVDALPGMLAGLPPGQHVIVTDAYLAVFLPPDRRAQLTEVLAQAGQTAPVTWLSLDPLVPLGPAGRDSVQGLDLPPGLVGDYQRDGVFAVLGARFFGGPGEGGQLLARAHPSGQWMEWLR
jgi:hypothetical protein